MAYRISIGFMYLANRKLCRVLAVITIMAVSLCQNGALASTFKFSFEVPAEAAPNNSPCHAEEDEGQNTPSADCKTVCHSVMPKSHVDTTIPDADLVQQPILLAQTPVVHVVEVGFRRLHDRALSRTTSPPPTLAYCRLLN